MEQKSLSNRCIPKIIDLVSQFTKINVHNDMYNIQGFMETLAAGIVFSIVYEKTGNIWYTISCHMMCNAFTFISNAAIICVITVLIAKKKGLRHVQNSCC